MSNLKNSYPELADTFDLLDMDKDGRLSRGEIAALLRTGKIEPTRKELDFIFSEMDHESGENILGKILIILIFIFFCRFWQN
jgi:Ca2+-binding EF-hand superfamily protein